ncbi:tRNA (guanosine(46)-N7)-methyltransferase TrmB [sulfur-oxidizing endosymbiont of Gigantopelta aegis]|uniref:tRNA (guanosine(46)-N7)-methyltransferase TrmB n=1 Tax=sulfur-oxidizing endosymbiont of Gigantopelta aegis TaxID=2794934 RepID=UPI001FE73A6E|nr:tRNA (guanosine(46)-N7)-methyltransferase TrmB [sulfur-oxidizing endosymbiont of Gigantopelta aegis]
MKESSEQVKHPRAIKSYVVRSGRMTLGQEKAFADLWSVFGIEPEAKLDFEQLFSRQAPVILEIGFGMGDSLIETATRHPENNYIGIEVHRPGVGRLLGNIGEQGLTNLRVMRFDAIEVLKNQIQDNSLSAVYLFFPDPWHKRKHHKRRIVQDDFIQLLRKKLILHGQFHMATDWEHYAKQMLESMLNAPGFDNCAVEGRYIPRPEYRPRTKFERRGERLGHGVWDILFEKIN